MLAKKVQRLTWGYCGLLDLIVLCQEQRQKMCSSQQICGGAVVDLHLHKDDSDVFSRCQAVIYLLDMGQKVLDER